MKNALETTFAGIVFKNPVVLASGTCGFGAEYVRLFDVSRLGGVCTKGLTLDPCAGNEGVRVWETASGVMNSVGLENPGVAAFIEHEAPRMKTLGTRVIVNLGGHSADEYLRGAEMLSAAGIGLLELNISCPNVASGGMAFGVETETARALVRGVRAAFPGKMTVKLSPAARDIAGMARACEDEGADALTVANTFPALAVDIERRKPVFTNVYAGLSGPAIKPLALRLVREVSRAVAIPVAGCGGVTTWRDALEFIMAGASLVQVGTASFMRPTAALDVIDGLERWCAENGVSSLAEVRGTV